MQPFATLSQAREFLGIQTQDEDALLTRLLKAASGWIRAYLNRDINAADYEDALDGSGNALMRLPNYPVISVTSVVVDGVTIPATSFVVRDGVLRRRDGGSWGRGIGNAVVNYRAGYEEIPDEVVQACLEVVAWRFRERSRIGQSQIATPQGQNITFQTSDVPQDVKTLLKNLRRVVPA